MFLVLPPNTKDPFASNGGGGGGDENLAILFVHLRAQKFEDEDDDEDRHVLWNAMHDEWRQIASSARLTGC